MSRKPDFTARHPERKRTTSQTFETTWNSGAQFAKLGALHATYEPSARRPIANIFRRTANLATSFCVAHGIQPDAISYASIAFAAIAALLFYYSRARPIFLLIAPLSCYARLWCNMLDGMVALASEKASWRGEIVNDLPDRISDILIFVGVAHSGWTHPVLGYWAAIAALLTAYVGVLGQAVGQQRQFGGIMSKPWRMVALHIGANVTWLYGHSTASLSILDWTCIAVIVGCLETVIVRLHRTLRS